MPKEHIGDGVYVGPWSGDPAGVVLTTEDGIGGPTNTIYLERGVIAALIDYLAANGLLPGQQK